MVLFDWIFNRRAVETVNGVITIEDALKDSLNSTGYFIDCSDTKGQKKAYEKCDVISSLVTRSAESIANLKVWTVDSTGKEVKTKDSIKFINKINNPNPYQDFKLFHRQLDTNVKLHGKCYVRKAYSDAFNEYDYYIIPNEYITEEWDFATDLLYNRKVKRYYINDNTVSYYLQPEEVYVFWDGILDTKGYQTFGGSRLSSLSEVISTYVTLWEVRTELYGDGGARNIISLGVKEAGMMGIPALKTEKDAFYKKLKGFGFRRTQDKNLVVSTDAKVSPLTAKIIDMDMEVSIKDAKKAMCNAFSCPPELLGIESSRFKTVPEARKEYYTQAGIPTAEYYLINWMYMMGMKNSDFKPIPDYSHMDFYQEARLQESIAFQQMAGAVVPLMASMIISKQEARIKLDLE